jgi:hypothetical protein
MVAQSLLGKRSKGYRDSSLIEMAANPGGEQGWESGGKIMGI